MELMTVKEVANFLRSNVNAINAWLSRNPDVRDKLTRKPRGRRFFIKSELENFILNNGKIE